MSKDAWRSALAARKKREVPALTNVPVTLMAELTKRDGIFGSEGGLIVGEGDYDGVSLGDRLMN